MKKLFTVLVPILICYQICAQKGIFVRIYRLDGKKISKGYLLGTTDTSLQLKASGEVPVNLSIDSIGTIKTKRSAGHSLAIGSLAVAGVFAIIAAATTHPDEVFVTTPTEAAAAGALVGLPLGAIIGGATALLRESKLFKIHGDRENWKAFQAYWAQQYSPDKNTR